MEHNKSHKLLSFAMIVLAVVVLVLSLVYLFTEWMIPGLLPICQALLMIPMFMLWKDREPKWISILFVVAGVLNVIAAIMQIFLDH